MNRFSDPEIMKYRRIWSTEFDVNKTNKELADEFHCSTFLIRKIKRRRLMLGLRAFHLKSGRKTNYRKISFDDSTLVKDISEIYRCTSAKQIRHHYEKLTSKKLSMSLPTLRRFLKENRIYKKLITGPHPLKFSSEEKEIYYFNYIMFRESDLYLNTPICFHDEVRFERNEIGTISVYGRHHAPRFKASDNCNESYTLSGVIQLHEPNYFIFDIVSGASNGAHFHQFITSELYPMLRPNSLLIVDGASFHVNGIEDLISIGNDVYGITYKRLPPYSPELNPIEKIWNIMKSHIRRETDLTKPVLTCILEAIQKNHN